jgi:hypothetical protein
METNAMTENDIVGWDGSILAEFDHQRIRFIANYWERASEMGFGPLKAL